MSKKNELETKEVYPIRECEVADCPNYTDQAVERDGGDVALCADHRDASGLKAAAEKPAEPEFVPAEQPANEVEQPADEPQQ